MTDRDSPRPKGGDYRVRAPSIAPMACEQRLAGSAIDHCYRKATVDIYQPVSGTWSPRCTYHANRGRTVKVNLTAAAGRLP